MTFKGLLYLPLLFLPTLVRGVGPRDAASPQGPIVIDDFEQDQTGATPSKWRFLSSKEEAFLPLDRYMNDQERFYVVEERGNKFLRGYTHAEALRISLPNTDVDWDLATHPIIQWDWRALRLPEGAREDKKNDTGAALYVNFAKKDWLGRPLSIKYTYSTGLPVGTIVDTGNVKVIVVSSGIDGLGTWQRIRRNVTDDFRKVFGEPAPERPFTITLWSDSDNTGSEGEADFDNIVLRAAW